MKRFIGTKLIAAVAMTRAAYNDFRGWKLPADENGKDDGYLVEYLDGGKPNVPSHNGYVSWSPKEQFEAAYRPCHQMTFGLAIEAMKRGDTVARTGWNGIGMFVYLVPANSYPAQTGAAKAHFGDGALVPYNAYMALKGVDDSVSTWAPSVGDVLAEDWALVELKKEFTADDAIEVERTDAELKKLDSTSTVPAHQQRVIVEKAELSEKVMKLGAFVGTPTFERLADEEQVRLSRQLESMTAYEQVLDERIDAFGIVQHHPV